MESHKTHVPNPQPVIVQDRVLAIGCHWDPLGMIIASVGQHFETTSPFFSPGTD
jgi:hypothetical protein